MSDKNMPGYIFPNIPQGWTQDERNFAIALQRLFDVLFVRTRGLSSKYEKDSYNSLKDKPSISNVLLVGNRTLADIGIHTVNEDRSGLMTVELFEKLQGIEEEATKTTECRPELDYLYMMKEIDLPTDESDKVEKVGDYYDAGVWNIQMVWDAVDKWITAEDYEDITGDPFPPFRPEPEEPEEPQEPGENE